MIKQLEKAYEESTQHEVQKGKSLIRQCTRMTTQARLQVSFKEYWKVLGVYINEVQGIPILK